MFGADIERRAGGVVSVCPRFDDEGLPTTSGGCFVADGALHCGEGGMMVFGGGGTPHQHFRTTFPTANHRNNGGIGFSPVKRGVVRGGPPGGGGAHVAGLATSSLHRVKGSISKAKSGGLSKFFSKSKSFSSLKELTKGRYGLCASVLEKNITHPSEPLKRRGCYGSETRLAELDEEYTRENCAGRISSNAGAHFVEQHAMDCHEDAHEIPCREVSPVPAMERVSYDEGAGREYEIQLPATASQRAKSNGDGVLIALPPISTPSGDGDLLVPSVSFDDFVSEIESDSQYQKALNVDCRVDDSHIRNSNTRIETLSESFQRLNSNGRQQD